MSSSRRSGPTSSTPTSTSGCRRRAMCGRLFQQERHDFNLLRDDLGQVQDITDYNYEVAYTRGTPGGEYMSSTSTCIAVAASPIRFSQDRRQREARSDGRGQTAGRDDGGAAQGEPGADALRFRLDANGGLVAGSVNSLFKPLRGGRKMIVSAIVFALLLGAFVFCDPAARGPGAAGAFGRHLRASDRGGLRGLDRAARPPKPLRLEWRGRGCPGRERDAGRERSHLCLAHHAGLIGAARLCVALERGGRSSSRKP